VYEGEKCYVATSKRNMKDSRVEFVSEDITGLIRNLREEQGKDIWIVGGGKLIDRFIKENLIDTYVITIIPTILGNGILLFLNENPEIKLRLIGTKTTNGMLELTYERKESI
jgi:dihydrofolate reductase